MCLVALYFTCQMPSLLHKLGEGAFCEFIASSIIPTEYLYLSILWGGTTKLSISFSVLGREEHVCSLDINILNHLNSRLEPLASKAVLLPCLWKASRWSRHAVFMLLCLQSVSRLGCYLKFINGEKMLNVYQKESKQGDAIFQMF